MQFQQLLASRLNDWDEARRNSHGPYADNTDMFTGDEEDRSPDGEGTTDLYQLSLKSPSFTEEVFSSKSPPQTWQNLEQFSSLSMHKHKPTMVRGSKRPRVPPDFYSPSLESVRQADFELVLQQSSKPETEADVGTSSFYKAKSHRTYAMNDKFGKKQDRKKWLHEEEQAVVRGVLKHSKNWASILLDPEFKILAENKRTHVDLEDKYCNLKSCKHDTNKVMTESYSPL